MGEGVFRALGAGGAAWLRGSRPGQLGKLDQQNPYQFSDWGPVLGSLAGARGAESSPGVGP
jgi:hypothetical protein